MKSQVKDFEILYEVMDSRHATFADKLADGKLILEARKKQMAQLSPELILEAGLIQLKLQMEESLKPEQTTNSYSFINFLQEYSSILYSDTDIFAKDLSIDSTFLNKVLEGEEEPNDELLTKLIAHTEHTFKNLINFKAAIWYDIYTQEKTRKV